MIGILQLLFVNPLFQQTIQPMNHPFGWLSWDDTFDPVLLVAKQMQLVVEFPTPLNKYDRQNGKSSSNKGENKEYLSCHHPDPFWLRKKLLYYKACQDMIFKEPSLSKQRIPS